MLPLELPSCIRINTDKMHIDEETLQKEYIDEETLQKE